jgi:GT2 family glycosyltransferase
MSGFDGGTTGRVTIVVASRNRKAQLLASLPRHAALPEHPPIVVVDDASSDGTAAVLGAAHPEVELVKLERRRGAAARNAGAAAARTPYVAFTDDDAWWRPGALARACALLDEHPDLALVQPRILVGPSEREDALCQEMAASPLPAGRGQPGHPLLSFIACAVVVRREAFTACGGFHERFGVGGEEELLGWDLAAAGWWMSYVPDVVAHHDPPRTARPRSERRARLVRNTLWTTWLRRPARAAAWRTGRDLLRFPRDRVTARGVAEAVAATPWVLRERRVSPPHVEALRRLLDDQQLRSPSRDYGA